MAQFLKLTTLLYALCQPLTVWAAEVTNNGEEQVVLRITEGGAASEVTVDAKQTVQFCLEGCFMTAPNGDKYALTGTEAIDISADVLIIE